MENLNVELVSHEKSSLFFGTLGRTMSSVLKALETLFYGTDYSKATVFEDLFVGSFILFSLLLFFTVISEWQIYIIKSAESVSLDRPFPRIKLTGKFPPIVDKIFYYLLYFLPLVTLSLYTLTPNSSNNLEYNDMSIAMGLSIAFILKVAAVLLLDYAKFRVKSIYQKYHPGSVKLYIIILLMLFSTWEIIRIFSDIKGAYSILEMLYGIIIGLPILVGIFLILFIFINIFVYLFVVYTLYILEF